MIIKISTLLNFNISFENILREGPASQPQNTLSCCKNLPPSTKNSNPPKVDHSFQICFDT